ncbi:D-glycero-beta-D-manno-heptose 1-phosphate adenylyltransferase [Haliovirga abyssi]|uniref:D-glycero-beta-D-manno-heptose 1-phosphate adenylyltransferase n=1 Tax=Haliovirga abyssi TaxID=2996794 RepID=A0AAU9D876_9FUSO|nr:glycerol-3-phosphate cytidylyltransferase [Haliovirga abyssi]
MKIIEKNNIEKIIKNLKQEKKTIVFTNGCFDILHVGHLRYLEEAKSYGDILVVGVNSDSSVRRLKGEKRPYVPENERMEMLAGLESVDYVVKFEEDTPIEILKQIKPDIHIKGGDYKEEDLPEAKVVKENGGIVKIVSLIQGKSTTNIIKEILNREDI